MPLLWTTCLLFIFCFDCCNSAVQAAARPSLQIRTDPVASPGDSPELSGRQPRSPRFVSADEQHDRQLFAEFGHRATRKNQVDDNPLGDRDSLGVPLPGRQEITGRETRISRLGTPPLVGTQQAEGLTEEALPEENQYRLGAYCIYILKPNIFVLEYCSRQVAVIGAVHKPSSYRSVGEADNLLDQLSQAGRLTKEASQQIRFIQAEPVGCAKALKLAATLPAQLTSRSSLPVFLKGRDPSVLSLALAEMAQGIESGESAWRALIYATNLRPSDLEAQRRLEQTYILQQSVDRAALALQKALDIGSGSAYAFQNLGIAEEGPREFFAANEAYGQAIELMPNTTSFLDIGGRLSHKIHWGCVEKSGCPLYAGVWRTLWAV